MAKQLYRVRLLKGHTAQPDQIAVGCLAAPNGDTMLYSRAGAVKKAELFGGRAEKAAIRQDIDIGNEEISPLEEEMVMAHIRRLLGVPEPEKNNDMPLIGEFHD